MKRSNIVNRPPAGRAPFRYFPDSTPKASGRRTLFERFSRYTNPQVERIAGDYVALAIRHGLDPAQMALAFVNGRGFVTSNIIGATTLDQLQSNLDSVNITLSDEVLQEIDAIHERQPNPAP